MRCLHDLVTSQATRAPDAIAVDGPDGVLTYGELDAISNRVASGLDAIGVRPRDRVLLWLDKSSRAIAAMQGVLKAGAAYVPVDARDPAVRAAQIASSCEVACAITTSSRAATLAGAQGVNCAFLTVDEAAPSRGIGWHQLASLSARGGKVHTTPSDIAYILYTSGSTGKPKGVSLAHANAFAFVEWAASQLHLSPRDRLSNHASFHFDLSVFDIYGAFYSGARVCVIPDAMSYSANSLTNFIMGKQITVWYSVPSALVMMMQAGGLLERSPDELRAVLFAGEVFPIKHLRALRGHMPHTRLLNLYGPTETNVCTFCEVRELPEHIEALTIGRPCCGDSVEVWRDDGTVANVGEAGEIVVSGPTVMQGYYGKEPLDGQSYRTGDIGYVHEDGNIMLLGRRDHMVKVRGHRIEPGEIEAALLTHPSITEAAVLLDRSEELEKLVAFVAHHGPEPSLLEVKRHLAARLPRYMTVNRVEPVDELPRTLNGKVDRVSLARRLQGESRPPMTSLGTARERDDAS